MQILNFKDVIGKPNVLGEFDVYFPEKGATFHMLKIVRTKKGGLMINFPAKCEKTEDGKYIFHPYITLAKHKFEEFQKQVIELLKPFLPHEFL